MIISGALVDELFDLLEKWEDEIEHYDNTHDKSDPEDWMDQKRRCCIELGTILEKHF